MADKSDNGIEAERIRALAALLAETGLTEIEIERGDLRLRVARAGAAGPANPLAAAPAAPKTAETPPPSAADAKNHPGVVASPMVGTAYLAPSPGAPPFVIKGDRVAAGQTLMIIEAMKTMNPIAAPRAGVVADIFVADAAPVEFGEALLVIE